MKQVVIREGRVFLTYTLFLTLFLCALSTYRRLILGEYAISYPHYGYGLIEALILSKVVILGRTLRIGEKFANKPLIVPTLYKTVVFSFFVLLFSILEHFVMGYIHGTNPEKIYEEFISIGLNEALIKVLIAFFVFVFFFAFMELARVIGEEKLVNLFLFRKHPKDHDETMGSSNQNKQP